MLNYLKQYRTSPFDSYRFYMATKLHFSGSYDAIKYHFKTSAAKPATFETHKQRFFFERAARNNPTHYSILEFYVFNILEGIDWIGEMNADAVTKRRNYLDSYSYNVKSELSKIHERGSLNDALQGPGIPYIFSMVDEGSISLETISVINNLVDFLKDCSSISDPLGVFDSKRTRILKYQPFLKDLVDHKKVRDLILLEFTPTH
jgi:hypothetical protein